MSVRFGGSVVLDKPIEDVYRFLTEAKQETDWGSPYHLSLINAARTISQAGSSHRV